MSYERRVQANRLRLTERSGDEGLKHGVLGLHRRLLAAPRLREIELFYANDQLEISGAAFRQRLARQMEAQNERAVAEILDVVP